MKFDLNRFLKEPTQVEAAQVGGPAQSSMSTAARERLRSPITAGLIIIVVCVLGLGLWASIAKIQGAVIGTGTVRVEANRKVIKSREGGVVRSIAVSEGDKVKAGQVLLTFDKTVPRAQVDILTNQRDVLLMQYARFRAEVTGIRTLTIPPELAARRANLAVQAIIQNETLVFTSRLAAYEGQGAILNQRFEQLQTAYSGLKMQQESFDTQTALLSEELKGYQTLYEKGYAPKTLILRLQRQLAELTGRRGALAADMTRNQQQAGETRLQLASLAEQRASEAATGLRETESRLADLEPRLNAAQQSLAQTDVVSPDAGYVLNLGQHTIGGVAASGETLMDVVPSTGPLVVTAQIKPNDIDEVQAGMTAEVTLSAYSSYKVGKLKADVLTVSADALSTDKGGSFYRVDLRIQPGELKNLPKGVHLYPGMPATVMIQTRQRTIMSYLLGPIGQMFDGALREQ